MNTLKSILQITSFGFVSCFTSTFAQKPNIVIILADDIGYGDLGCYGASNISTPNIDKLASQGVRFSNAYAPASTSTPTRYAMLTGEYAFRKNIGILPGDATLTIDVNKNNLPLQLKSSGYTTAIVGKWHLGLGSDEEPVDFNKQISHGLRTVGFDYSYVFPATNDRVPTVYMENDKVVGLDVNDPIQISYTHKIGNEPTGKENPELLKLKYFQGHDGTIVNGISRMGWISGGKKAHWTDENMADTLLAKAVDFIEKSGKKPFFLYYATHDAHEPRAPHARFAGKSKAGVYGDVIEEFDYCVGEIIQTLKKKGIWDNTIIIVTSDNGPMIKEGYLDGALENIGSHDPFAGLRGAKYSLYEGGSKVPFIFYWGAKVKKAFVQEQRFCYSDLLATLASFTGDKAYRNSFNDSHDASKLFLKAKAPLYRDYIVTQNNGGQVTIRKNDWKLIPPTNSKKGELYNLKNDSFEKNNLFESTSHQKIVEELSKLIIDLKKQ